MCVCIYIYLYIYMFFPSGWDDKESACNLGDLGSIPGLGRFPGEGNSYPPQYSGLENSMDRGAWQATVHGVPKSRAWLSDFHIYMVTWGCKESDTTEQLYHTHIYIYVCAQSCLTLCHPMDHSPPDSSVHGDSPGKNTGVGCQALLQSIFATQVLSPGLPNCRRILYHLSHQVSLFASVARL